MADVRQRPRAPFAVRTPDATDAVILTRKAVGRVRIEVVFDIRYVIGGATVGLDDDPISNGIPPSPSAPAGNPP